MSRFVPSVDFLVASWPPLSLFETARGPLPDLTTQAAGGVPERARRGRGSAISVKAWTGVAPLRLLPQGSPQVGGGRGWDGVPEGAASRSAEVDASADLGSPTWDPIWGADLGNSEPSLGLGGGFRSHAFSV